VRGAVWINWRVITVAETWELKMDRTFAHPKSCTGHTGTGIESC
jgi:hypothetical protein